MNKSMILTGKIKDDFCKELDINNNYTKIIIRIRDNKADYYDFDKDCFCELDINVAKKYM